MAYTNIDGITVEQFNEIMQDLGYYDEMVFHMGEFNEIYSGDPYEAIRAAYYGGRYGFSRESFHPNDEYFTYNGYGNLVSILEYDLQDYFDHNFKDDILDYVNENEIELYGVEEDEDEEDEE